MTEYRQIFRPFYYQKRQLTLPPENLWEFKIETAKRKDIQGHDYIVVEYEMLSYLLGPADSVAASEPALTVIGGVFEDKWFVREEGRIRHVCSDGTSQTHIIPASLEALILSQQVPSCG
jgi:hypothetical protein